MKPYRVLFYYSVLCAILSSCSSGKLTTTEIIYQSVKTKHIQPTKANPIPENAKIVIAYSISDNGDLTAIVHNRTNEIMTIDQTMSFFVNSDGSSKSYYDPTIRTTSVTDMSSVTKGATVNLGSITGALGIGGSIGQLANGINLGGSGTNGEAITNTTYIADQPQVTLAPHSNGIMSKTFNVSKLGANKFNTINNPKFSESSSYCQFSICISYSFDNGKTFEKIVTNFYADSFISVPINKNEQINDALRNVFSQKPDALNEPWWLLYFKSNTPGVKTRTQGILFDYQ